MEPQQNPTTHSVNYFERINNWIKESVTIKLCSIGFLVLILLIPQSWIESLIVERKARAESVVREIATKWSDPQTVSGPVLIIPFTKYTRVDRGSAGIEVRESVEHAFFLPQELKISGTVRPQILHRGIFESAVYESSLSIDANFTSPDFEKLNIDPKDVRWQEARWVIGLSDLRGISENPKLMMGEQALTGEPSNDIGISATYPINASVTNGYDYKAPAAPLARSSGIVMPLQWKSADNFRAKATIKINLKGSSLLYFSPVGKTTTVQLKSPWTSPAFDGAFLPASRKISTEGFEAAWKVLHYNRPFAQQWIGESQNISGSEFGVRLLIPVDQYQKSIRTAKYGVLVIILTFISLFMVEIIRKVRIHPFQYMLIGAAMIVYYCMLLSFSEQLGFDIAYVLATLATVLLVTAYSVSFLRERKTVAMFSSWLTIFYIFIFIIIQQEDYSLLIGSVGLFLIIGLIMYFSRKIDWYGKGSK